jgi:NADPH:quinone reductase-like Zn-dependent oxidoreductase
MKAIQIQQYGGAEQLEMVEIPKPKAVAGQVVVRILATSFNPIDPKRASGVMRQVLPLEFPYTPGGDFSGVIDSVGPEVESFTVGDGVFGYSPEGGAYAEFIAVDAHKIARKPQSVGHEEAASLAVVAQTALQMIERAGLRKGQTVLIQGAGGAVGGIAVQIAHRLGAIVIATASAASLDRVRGYGADQVIDYVATRFADVVKDVDAVLDTVGGEVQHLSFGVLKPGGVLVAISQPPAPEEAVKHQVNASMLLTEVSTRNLESVAGLVDAGEIQPCIGKLYPLKFVAEAWRGWPSAHVQGKIVFTVGG